MATPDTNTTVDSATDPYVPAGDTGYRIPQLIYNPQGISQGNVEYQKTNIFAGGLVSSPEPIDQGISTGFGENTKPLIAAPVTDIQAASNTDQIGFSNPAYGTTSDLGGLLTTQQQGVQRAGAQASAQKDWRFRMSLAPGANYLYKDPQITSSSNDILSPLILTDGVIFPYTPTIQISYSANYDPTDLAHTNYKIYQYKNSSVGEISITADFTAQDTGEANYLLAVIHFFKSVTKMFYGNDSSPQAGTPPPLCYLSGFGKYQFNNHPVAVTGFTYSLPNDVDYLKAGVVANLGGQPSPPKSGTQLPGSTNLATLIGSFFRLNSSGLSPGARSKRPQFNLAEVSEPTYVPTKIQISLTCIPIISRYAMANQFSLRDYARGTLTVGSSSNTGGIW